MGIPASRQASNCALADVAAKTAFVLGPEEGEAFLARHNLAALMIMHDRERRRLGPWVEQLVEGRI